MASSFVRRISTSVVRHSSDAYYTKVNTRTCILPHWKHELEYAKTHGPAGMRRWNFICYYIAAPLLILISYKVGKQTLGHPHERPPFVKYEYKFIRTKKFPWGDGNRTLFHNPAVNALPEGYEDEM